MTSTAPNESESIREDQDDQISCKLISEIIRSRIQSDKARFHANAPKINPTTAPTSPLGSISSSSAPIEPTKTPTIKPITNAIIFRIIIFFIS